jgi:hypothetical protein
MNSGTTIWSILKVTFFLINLILIFNGKHPCAETYV